MRRLSVGLAAVVVAAGAAGGCAAQAQWTAHLVAVIEGFEVPECVVVDADAGVAYVSNVVAARQVPPGGSPYWTDDGAGFVSRLKIPGTLDELRWRDSTPAAPLNAPKGMCLVGTLWVADNARLLRFATDSADPPVAVEVPGAQRLNDVATDGCRVYVSDTATGSVHAISHDERAVIKGPPAVNGVTYSKGRLFAVSWDLHEVYELDPSGAADPQPFGVAEHFTNLDGIEVLDDGSFIVSDFRGNKVSVIAPDRKTVRTLIEIESPADIGLDRRRMLLYVPQFLKDRVAVYQLRKQ